MNEPIYEELQLYQNVPWQSALPTSDANLSSNNRPDSSQYDVPRALGVNFSPEFLSALQNLRPARENVARVDNRGVVASDCHPSHQQPNIIDNNAAATAADCATVQWRPRAGRRDSAADSEIRFHPSEVRANIAQREANNWKKKANLRALRNWLSGISQAAIALFIVGASICAGMILTCFLLKIFYYRPSGDVMDVFAFTSPSWCSFILESVVLFVMGSIFILKLFLIRFVYDS